MHAMLVTALQCGPVIGAGQSVIFLTFFRSVIIRSRGWELFTHLLPMHVRIDSQYTEQSKGGASRMHFRDRNIIQLF